MAITIFDFLSHDAILVLNSFAFVKLRFFSLLRLGDD